MPSVPSVKYKLLNIRLVSDQAVECSQKNKGHQEQQQINDVTEHDHLEYLVVGYPKLPVLNSFQITYTVLDLGGYFYRHVARIHILHDPEHNQLYDRNEDRELDQPPFQTTAVQNPPKDGDKHEDQRGDEKGACDAREYWFGEDAREFDGVLHHLLAVRVLGIDVEQCEVPKSCVVWEVERASLSRLVVVGDHDLIQRDRVKLLPNILHIPLRVTGLFYLFLEI